MKLFVKTKDKKYPIYFSVNSHINIKKILIKNNINPKKLIVVYDKNVPKNITNKFKHTLKEGENVLEVVLQVIYVPLLRVFIKGD